MGPWRWPDESLIYIGRRNIRHGFKASKWANPYVVGIHGTRREVLALYQDHLLGSPSLVAALPELAGKNLACWCAPDECHGNVLQEYAEGRCYACGQPIWEHEFAGEWWEGGEDWSAHQFKLAVKTP